MSSVLYHCAWLLWSFFRCVICRVDYEDGESLTALSCKHLYHPECINNWLKINKVLLCPSPTYCISLLYINADCKYAVTDLHVIVSFFPPSFLTFVMSYSWIPDATFSCINLRMASFCAPVWIVSDFHMHVLIYESVRASLLLLF